MCGKQIATTSTNTTTTTSTSNSSSTSFSKEGKIMTNSSLSPLSSPSSSNENMFHGDSSNVTSPNQSTDDIYAGIMLATANDPTNNNNKAATASSADDEYGYGEAEPDIQYKHNLLLKTSSGSSSSTSSSCCDDFVQAAVDDVTTQKKRCSGVYLRSASMDLQPRRSSMRVAGCPPRRNSCLGPHSGEEFIVYLPGQDKPILRKRSISFSETVHVRNIEVVRPSLLWLQSKDYKRIQQSSLKVVKKVESGKLQLYNNDYNHNDNKKMSNNNSKDNTKEMEKYCTRGLEQMLLKEKYLELKYSAWDSVLEEQDVQRDQGYFDEELLAKVYQISSEKATEEAKRRAIQDSQEISLYIRGANTTQCRRLSMS